MANPLMKKRATVVKSMSQRISLNSDSLMLNKGRERRANMIPIVCSKLVFSDHMRMDIIVGIRIANWIIELVNATPL
jgi:hypothetical protein